MDGVHGGIIARGIARSFGGVQAVADATLEVLPGRITGLVGPNGAGKTTLMLVLASLLAPDSGEVRIGGEDPIANPADARRRLGWMPDALGAWDSLTVRETLVVAGRLYDIPRRVAEERAEQLIDDIGLTALAASPARVLSRGQKQLLGLARALVHEPAVLLLDEPASGLDPSARILLRARLRRLADDGCAILVSSHVLAELDEMVDDAVFMNAGRVVPREPAVAGRIRDWRIRVAGTADPSASLDAVRSALPDTEVRAERRDLLAGFPDEVSAARALADLVGAGLAISVFAPAAGDIEAAFLDMKEGRS